MQSCVCSSFSILGKSSVQKALLRPSRSRREARQVCVGLFRTAYTRSNLLAWESLRRIIIFANRMRKSPCWFTLAYWSKATSTNQEFRPRAFHERPFLSADGAALYSHQE